MFDDLSDLYQEVILDHSKSPRNYGKLEGANRRAHGQNPLCGDEIIIHLLMKDDVIEDVRFEGSGCAISKASASLLTTGLKGKTREEVKALFEKIRSMVTTGSAEGAEDLGKFAVFAGVHKFPARVKCAILPWHAAVAALEGQTEPVSTE